MVGKAAALLAALVAAAPAWAQEFPAKVVEEGGSALVEVLRENPLALLAVAMLVWREAAYYLARREHRAERAELVAALDKANAGTASILQALEWLKGFEAKGTGS